MLCPGIRNVVAWLSQLNADFWLVSNFLLGIQELAFVVLATSLGHWWYCRNNTPHSKKLQAISKSLQLVPLNMNMILPMI
jgi:hypothetical protein